jgi:hypothetical protein
LVNHLQIRFKKLPEAVDQSTAGELAMDNTEDPMPTEAI